jgi:hypothetical protein
MKENNTYHEGMETNNLPDSLRVNPFVVPKNYFNGLNEAITSQIKLESSHKKDLAVPLGYFEKLQENILIKIAEEKLRDQIQTDGFGHPDDYFSSLQNDILLKVSENKLKSIVTQDGFQTPSLYFSEFNDQISAKIITENLKHVVPTDGFEAPNSYFETLTTTITKTIHVESASDLPTEDNIRFIKKKISWSKYAIAASLIGILGIGSYFVIQSSSLQQEQKNLSHVSDQEIINYLAQTGNGDDLLYVAKYIDEKDIVGTNGKIKDEDIEDYLKYTL